MKRRPVTGRDLCFAVAGALLVAFLAVPLAFTVVGTPPELLGRVLGAAEVRRSLTLTFLASALATVIGLSIGVPLAHLLARRRFRGRSLVEGLIGLPVVVPHTAAGVALLMVFGRQGLLGEPLSRLGLRFTDNVAGITLAMLFVGVPFLVTAGRDAFALVESETEQAALTDGAGPWQVFFLVTLPAAWRGVVSGALMMWARGISEFGAVVILAYHPKVLPVLVYEFFEAFGVAAAGAVSAVLIVVALLVFVVARLALSRSAEE